jgi:hypothetical protein
MGPRVRSPEQLAVHRLLAAKVADFRGSSDTGSLNRWTLPALTSPSWKRPAFQGWLVAIAFTCFGSIFEMACVTHNSARTDGQSQLADVAVLAVSAVCCWILISIILVLERLSDADELRPQHRARQYTALSFVGIVLAYFVWRALEVSFRRARLETSKAGVVMMLAGLAAGRGMQSAAELRFLEKAAAYWPLTISVCAAVATTALGAFYAFVPAFLEFGRADLTFWADGAFWAMCALHIVVMGAGSWGSSLAARWSPGPEPLDSVL